MDLAEESPGFQEMLKMVHEFYVEEMQVWADTDVDALNFMDDWGSQQSLLISPDQWRRLFKPLYRDYIDIAHAAGKKAFMHSDGYILDVIPDLIELGLDALNSQIFCMGVENLAPFRGKLCFWGEIDRQHLLRSGTPTEIRSAVELVHDTLNARGGVIAQCEFGPGVNPENVREVFTSWNEVSAD